MSFLCGTGRVNSELFASVSGLILGGGPESGMHLGPPLPLQPLSTYTPAAISQWIVYIFEPGAKVPDINRKLDPWPVPHSQGLLPTTKNFLLLAFLLEAFLPPFQRHWAGGWGVFSVTCDLMTPLKAASCSWPRKGLGLWGPAGSMTLTWGPTRRPAPGLSCVPQASASLESTSYPFSPGLAGLRYTSRPLFGEASEWWAKVLGWG